MCEAARAAARLAGMVTALRLAPVSPQDCCKDKSTHRQEAYGPRCVVNAGEGLYQLLVKVLGTKHWRTAGEGRGSPKFPVVSLQCSTPLLFLVCLDRRTTLILDHSFSVAVPRHRVVPQQGQAASGNRPGPVMRTCSRLQRGASSKCASSLLYSMSRFF